MIRTVGDTRFVSISEAKSILPKLVEDSTPTVLLRHNQPVAAVMSIDRFNDYIALERLMRNPALFDRLRAAADKARKTPLEVLRVLEDFEEKPYPSPEERVEKTWHQPEKDAP